MVITPDRQIDRQRELHAALPEVSNTLYVDGLDDTIDIYRDRYGIPHVRAHSTRDPCRQVDCETGTEGAARPDHRAGGAHRQRLAAAAPFRNPPRRPAGQPNQVPGKGLARRFRINRKRSR